MRHVAGFYAAGFESVTQKFNRPVQLIVPIIFPTNKVRINSEAWIHPISHSQPALPINPRLPPIHGSASTSSFQSPNSPQTMAGSAGGSPYSPAGSDSREAETRRARAASIMWPAARVEGGAVRVRTVPSAGVLAARDREGASLRDMIPARARLQQQRRPGTSRGRRRRIDLLAYRQGGAQRR